jgi:hypothetical protein
MYASKVPASRLGRLFHYGGTFPASTLIRSASHASNRRIGSGTRDGCSVGGSQTSDVDSEGRRCQLGVHERGERASAGRQIE